MGKGSASVWLKELLVGKGSTVVATEAQIFVESALLTRVKQFTAKSQVGSKRVRP